MDDGRFDAMVRMLGAESPRRRVLAGLLAALPLAFGERAAAKKKKQQCKGKKKCGSQCIPKADCCTNAECGPNRKCVSGKCVCTPNCAGKECGSDDCGGSCGTCQNGICPGRNCFCPFPPIRTDPICNPRFCDSCSPGVCCTTGQTCVSGSCGACPDTPNPCDQEHFCGATSADNDEPFCYCVTSVDGAPTCTSVFANKFQSRDCTSDADCATLVNLGGLELVCVNSPCSSPFMVNQNVSKICMNKGCVDLNARRTERADGKASGIRQLSLRAKG